jgi:gluconokinase
VIVVVAGVSGSGKTTVGTLLAQRLGWPFTDGDDFHPAASVARMRSGQPLTDADRQPWLAAIGTWLDREAAAGHDAVLTCSALRRSYRDGLLTGRPSVWLVFLAISEVEVTARLAHRAGHFFPATLVTSQFAALEPPAGDEKNAGRTVTVPVQASSADVVTGILRRLGLS